MNLRRLRGYETDEPSPLLHCASVPMLLAVKRNELTVLMGDRVVVRGGDGKRWPWCGGRRDKRAASEFPLQSGGTRGAGATLPRPRDQNARVALPRYVALAYG